MSEEELDSYNRKYGELLETLIFQSGVSREEVIMAMRDYELNCLADDRAEWMSWRAKGLQSNVRPIKPLQDNDSMIDNYLLMVEGVAEVSKATALKVGALIVRDYTIIAEGVNGTAPGSPNVCENPHTGRTYDWVTHAEDNALKKLNYAASGSHMFLTHSPCRHCAALIGRAGVQYLYSVHAHKDAEIATKRLEFYGVTVVREGKPLHD